MVRSAVLVAALLGLVGCDRWYGIPEPATRDRGFQGLVPVLVGDEAVVLAGVDYRQATVRGLVIDLAASPISTPSGPAVR